MHLPGFLNPLTPFKQGLTLLKGAAKNLETVAATPVKMAQDEMNIFKDTLHLNFKGALKDQVKAWSEPDKAVLNVAKNTVSTGGKMVKSEF